MIRNKYMRWGVWMLLAGVILNIAGWLVMEADGNITVYKVIYKWSMIFGVILFGAGFLYILYSLIRKVERSAIIEERAEAAEEINSSKSSA